MVVTEQSLREELKLLEVVYAVNLSPMETKPYYDHIIKECLWRCSYEKCNTRSGYSETLKYLFKSKFLSLLTTTTEQPNETNFCYIKE